MAKTTGCMHRVREMIREGKSRAEIYESTTMFKRKTVQESIRVLTPRPSDNPKHKTCAGQVREMLAREIPRETIIEELTKQYPYNTVWETVRKMPRLINDSKKRAVEAAEAAQRINRIEPRFAGVDTNGARLWWIGEGQVTKEEFLPYFTNVPAQAQMENA